MEIDDKSKNNQNEEFTIENSSASNDLKKSICNEEENDDNDAPNEEDENQKDKSDDININKIKISTVNRDSSIDKPKVERHKTDKVNDLNEENINFETNPEGFVYYIL